MPGKTVKIIDIMQNTLNYVDARLMDHGKRVSYMAFKILHTQNKYTEKQLRDICIIAMLHDIGAYKTEEISKMVVFETTNIWEHSVYGYLFLKYFSPLSGLAPAICFHHADCHDLRYVHESYHDLAQIISLCDRADIYSQTVDENMIGFRESVENVRDIKFRSDIVDMFFAADINISQINDKLKNDKKFYRALYGTPLMEKEVSDYLKMIILSIEFRSRQTVIHTIAAACVSKILAGMMGLSEADILDLASGAMLHDIGKTGIPVAILENPGKLNEDDMKIMKSHVNITDKIIAGNVPEKVRRIAVRHHEKLNGKGYPQGLAAPELSVSERIIAIADIFSALCGARSYHGAYPKEKILEILNDMSAHGLIDGSIVDLASTHFELIMDDLYIESQPVVDMYDKINREFQQLTEKIKNIKNRGDLGGLLIEQEFALK